MSRIISIQEAEVLLEKYYDGLTSKEEERLLHDFLAREDVPARFHAEKAMFGYFDNQKKVFDETIDNLQILLPDFDETEIKMRTTSDDYDAIEEYLKDAAAERQEIQAPEPRAKGKILRMISWMSVAAVVMAFIFTTRSYSQSKNDFAYINGKKCTNINIIKKEAITSMNVLSDENDEVSKSANLLESDNEIIEQQLSVFAGLD